MEEIEIETKALMENIEIETKALMENIEIETKTLRIALVGKTGHGKSATGNTILRKIVFQESDNTDDATEILVLHSKTIDNCRIKVYDTPGLMRTKLTPAECKKMLRKDMDYLISSANGIDVFILVLNQTSRFTEEEFQTVQRLETIFGKAFLATHGIVVVTHGGDLYSSCYDSVMLDEKFKSWCYRQGNRFKDLLAKVNNRVLLVCNKGDILGNKRLTFSEKIISMSLELFRKNGSYTKEKYELVRRCVIS